MGQFFQWTSILHTRTPSGCFQALALDVGFARVEPKSWAAIPLTSLGSIAFGCVLQISCPSCGLSHPHSFIETLWETWPTHGKPMDGIGIQKSYKSYATYLDTFMKSTKDGN